MHVGSLLRVGCGWVLQVRRRRRCWVLRWVACVRRVGGLHGGVGLLRLRRVAPAACICSRLRLLVTRPGSILLRLLVLRRRCCIVLWLRQIACKLRLLCRGVRCLLRMGSLLALHVLAWMRWLLQLLWVC